MPQIRVPLLILSLSSLIAAGLLSSCDTLQHGTTHRLGNPAHPIYIPSNTRAILTVDRHRLDYFLNTSTGIHEKNSVADRSVVDPSIPFIIKEAEEAVKTTFSTQLDRAVPSYNWEHLWRELAGVEGSDPQSKTPTFGIPMPPETIVDYAEANEADVLLVLEYISMEMTSTLAMEHELREPKYMLPQFRNMVFLDIGIRAYNGHTGSVLGESNLGMGSNSTDFESIDQIPFQAANLALTAAEKNFARLTRILKSNP